MDVMHDIQDLRTKSRTYNYDWIVENSRPSPSKMVLAGFVFVGHVDVVQCTECNIQLAEWFPDDDPKVRHSIVNSTCRFVDIECGPLSNARHPDHSTYMDLLQRNHNISRPVQLAEAGLYDLGDEDHDRVACFSCKVELKNLQLHPDLMRSHAQYSPHCPWLNRIKGLDYIKQCQDGNVSVVKCRYF